jgi:1-acyl-sn-glycerol-3-phosphate acyltransferase
MAFVLAWGIVIVIVLLRGRRSGQSLAEFLLRGALYGYVRLWHRWQSNDPAPLPATGPAILFSNHTCSADPAFLLVGCRRRLSFLIAREFYLIPGVRQLCDYIHCVPVTRSGKDVTAARTALRRLKEGHVLCIFPEGGLSTAGRRFRPGKPGVALLALRSKVPIFPAFIAGGPQVSDVLPAWLWPSRGVHVTYGPAIDLSVYYDRPIDRKLLEEVAVVLMGHVAALQPNCRFPAQRHVFRPSV